MDQENNCSLIDENDDQLEKEFMRGRSKMNEGDFLSAEEIFSSIVMKGHSKAMVYLGLLYIKGIKGVEQNTNRGLSLLLSAARLGNVQAMNELGDYFKKVNDMPASLVWHRKAADRGLADSKNLLSSMNT